MAHYFMDENGDFSTMEKKKKKHGNRYVMDENGDFRKVQTTTDTSSALSAALTDTLGPKDPSGKYTGYMNAVIKAGGYTNTDTLLSASSGKTNLSAALLAASSDSSRDALYEKWGHYAQEADFDEIADKGAKLPDNPISYAMQNRVLLSALEKTPPAKRGRPEV